MKMRAWMIVLGLCLLPRPLPAAGRPGQLGATNERQPGPWDNDVLVCRVTSNGWREGSPL